MEAGHQSRPPRVKGRGTSLQTANRFERLAVEPDVEHLDPRDPLETSRPQTEFYREESVQVITENNSPDIPFRYSINPYRGCEHGCSYCYARPGHEYLGFSAGLDFETKVLVKEKAAAILRRELNHPRWQGDWLALSGVTDCYQPIERKLRLTRAILEVLAEAQQAVRIVTKNALVVRDLDILAPMAKLGLAQVALSVTSLDQEFTRVLEPRTSAPPARLRAIRELTAGGVPVCLFMAPMIPGLNDTEMAGVLQAAAGAGAIASGMQLLRLPLAVEPIFVDWLQTHRPRDAERVIARIRQVRGGDMSDSRFHTRFRGEGGYAEALRQSFRAFSRKFGLASRMPPLDTTRFRPPTNADGQQRLF